MAYEDLMKPDEDWRNLPDSAHRRKLQNRLAQRAYRRNLRERNHEVEQLKQKIRELQDAARGTPLANDLAAMGLNTPWDVPPGSTQNMDFTGEQIKPDISLSHQTSIAGQPSTVQGSANMEEFDFFTSFDDHTQSAPNPPTAEASNSLSMPSKKPPIPQQNQPQQTHHSLTRSRTDCTPSSISDPTETNTSPSTSSSTSSSSRRHTRPPLMTRSSAPTPFHTALDTSTNITSPCNQIDPNINVPRPSLSLIHLAVAAGNADTLRLLLQDLALPVNKRDQAGYTPLQRAVMSGRTDLVTVLLENGAGAATDDETADWPLDMDLVAVQGAGPEASTSHCCARGYSNLWNGEN